MYVFLEDRIMLLEVWPSLKAVQKIDKSPWEEFEPRFRVLLPGTPGLTDVEDGLLPDGEEFAQQRRRAFGAFRANIPAPVAASVENFQTRQWQLLRLMQKSPAAVELAGINPALCFALANYKRFRTRFCTLEGAAIVAKRRQRDIADWVGFPGTDAAARVLAKVRPESVSMDLLKSLCRVICAKRGNYSATAREATPGQFAPAPLSFIAFSPRNAPRSRLCGEMTETGKSES